MYISRIKIALATICILVVVGIVAITLAPSSTNTDVSLQPSPNPSGHTHDQTEVEDPIKHQLEHIVAENTPKEAFQFLDAEIEHNAEVFRDCHRYVHVIGHEAFEKYGFAGAMEYQSDLCGSGYTHGVLETYLEGSDNLESDLATICSEFDGPCFHGVGHGLMFYTDYNIDRSLNLCEVFPTQPQRVQCSEGVFMQLFNVEPSVYIENFSIPTIFDVCDTVDSLHQSACYFYAPRYIVRINEDRFTEAIDACKSIQTAGRFDCIRGVGSVMMKMNVKQPTYVEEMCSSFSNRNEQEMCITGMSSYYLVNFASPKKASELCPMLSTENQGVCEKTINDRAHWYPQE